MQRVNFITRFYYIFLSRGILPEPLNNSHNEFTKRSKSITKTSRRIETIMSSPPLTPLQTFSLRKWGSNNDRLSTSCRKIMLGNHAGYLAAFYIDFCHSKYLWGNTTFMARSVIVCKCRVFDDRLGDESVVSGEGKRSM